MRAHRVLSMNRGEGSRQKHIRQAGLRNFTGGQPEAITLTDRQGGVGSRKHSGL